MKLPYTSASPVLWMDSSEKFITKDQNNKVFSVIDRISDQPIIQNTLANRPIWSPTALNKSPGLIFNHNEWLHADYIAKYFNAGTTPIILMNTFKLAIGTLPGPPGRGYYTSSFSLSTGTSLFEDILAFGILANLLKANAVISDDSGNFATIRPDFNDYKAHVITIIYDPTLSIVSGHSYATLTLRLDGQIVGQASVLTEAGKGLSTRRDSFTIGAIINSTIAPSFYSWSGAIGQVLVYLGYSGIYDVEQALLQDLNQ